MFYVTEHKEETVEISGYRVHGEEKNNALNTSTIYTKTISHNRHWNGANLTNTDAGTWLKQDGISGGSIFSGDIKAISVGPAISNEVCRVA